MGASRTPARLAHARSTAHAAPPPSAAPPSAISAATNAHGAPVDPAPPPPQSPPPPQCKLATLKADTHSHPLTHTHRETRAGGAHGNMHMQRAHTRAVRPRSSVRRSSRPPLLIAFLHPRRRLAGRQLAAPQAATTRAGRGVAAVFDLSTCTRRDGPRAARRRLPVVQPLVGRATHGPRLLLRLTRRWPFPPLLDDEELLRRLLLVGCRCCAARMPRAAAAAAVTIAAAGRARCMLLTSPAAGGAPAACKGRRSSPAVTRTRRRRRAFGWRLRGGRRSPDASRPRRPRPLRPRAVAVAPPSRGSSR